MKRVLIIRSVSFQQLDKNLTALREFFPGAELHLLTHSHGLERAKTYGELSEVIDYGSRKNFSSRLLPPSLKRSGTYDAVVVPATNLTGMGFLNVLAMAARVGAKKIYMCNLVSEIREVPRHTITGRRLISGILTVTAGVLTVPVFLVMIPVLAGVSLAGFFRKKGDKPGGRA